MMYRYSHHPVYGTVPAMALCSAAFQEQSKANAAAPDLSQAVLPQV